MSSADCAVQIESLDEVSQSSSHSALPAYARGSVGHALRMSSRNECVGANEKRNGMNDVPIPPGKDNRLPSSKDPYSTLPRMACPESFGLALRPHR
jgi:hypothetical protein